MKAIILAGGYGVRLQKDLDMLKVQDKERYEIYKKIEGMPKPLIPICGKPILSYLMDKLENTEIRDVVIRTNNDNHHLFVAWKEAYTGPLNIDVLSDGSPENTYGQGVIGGVLFLLEKKNIQDDVLLLAGDTLFDYDLTEPLAVFRQKKKTVIVAHKEREDVIRQRGVVEFTDDHKITTYVEKPEHPPSEYAATPTFLFDKDCVASISRYLKERGGDKNLGDIVVWFLEQKKDLFVYLSEKEMFDVGDVKSIELAENFFTQKQDA